MPSCYAGQCRYITLLYYILLRAYHSSIPNLVLNLYPFPSHAYDIKIYSL